MKPLIDEIKRIEKQYPPSMKCKIITGRIPPPDICFINSLFDDMEGISVLRTDNSEEGRMEFWLAPDYEEEFHRLFNAIKEQTGVEMELTGEIEESTEITEFKLKQKDVSSIKE